MRSALSPSRPPSHTTLCSSEPVAFDRATTSASSARGQLAWRPSAWRRRRALVSSPRSRSFPSDWNWPGGWALTMHTVLTRSNPARS